MKAITINVSEPVYEAYKAQARKQDRTASELIREAMEHYRNTWSRQKTSLLDFPPLQLGQVVKPLSSGEDLLAEMNHDNRD